MTTRDVSTTMAICLTSPRWAGSAGPHDVIEAMKDVVDPELGINVVDLGLVYGVDVDDHSNAVST